MWSRLSHRRGPHSSSWKRHRHEGKVGAQGASRWGLEVSLDVLGSLRGRRADASGLRGAWKDIGWREIPSGWGDGLPLSPALFPHWQEASTWDLQDCLPQRSPGPAPQLHWLPRSPKERKANGGGDC